MEVFVPKYSIQWLRESFARGERYEYLFFWSHKGPAGCYSQWYPCNFTVGEFSYNCAEQYMMAQKAFLFADLDVFGKILQASDPKEIKALGRKVKGFDSEIWDIHKARIVVEGNIAKFGQNVNIKANLIATGSKILVEASPKDKVWGIGLATADAVRMEPSDWPGENLLGFALMLVRETFN